MRKICNVQLRSKKMVKSFGGIRKDEILSLVSSIRSARAFGKRFKDRDKLIKLLKDIFILVSGFDVADLFPSWKLLHKRSGVEPRLMNIENLENKATKNKGIGEFGGEYLVDVLLRLLEDAKLECPITNDHINVVILVSFLPSHDLLPSDLTFLLLEVKRQLQLLFGY
ncbi:hypothetical protein H5410_031172 [Solanum commersonii]|uniref:Uncharacterized protein n=1 Tax=Solanum commersonii TaxID=4109 RepID=A0A9J5YHN0_SOLCO|nr:hypothetical protein H5410_031172 [Solanum commersonii]